MSEAIIVAIITGGLSLIGVIVSNNHTAQSMDAKLDKQKREESNTWQRSITFWASFPPRWRQC